jgi:hypothetical protein
MVSSTFSDDFFLKFYLDAGHSAFGSPADEISVGTDEFNQPKRKLESIEP